MSMLVEALLGLWEECELLHVLDQKARAHHSYHGWHPLGFFFCFKIGWLEIPRQPSHGNLTTTGSRTTTP